MDKSEQHGLMPAQIGEDGDAFGDAKKTHGKRKKIMNKFNDEEA